MSDNSIAEQKISQLKIRLESAINARSELEDDFSQQSALLINFISKLSQTCKGIDILLDNKLANLRALLKKSVAFADLEAQIITIAALLQQHSIEKDKNIQTIHEQLQTSGLSLQKVSTLPKKAKKELKALVADTKKSQGSLIQYVPIMSQFIALYEHALKAKNGDGIGLLSALNQVPSTTLSKVELPQPTTIQPSKECVSKELINRFSEILNALILSEKHKPQLNQIKSKLSTSISNDVLMSNCLFVFDLIIDDLQQERKSEKIFLSTLSETLSSVQNSVCSTISNSESSQEQHQVLNKQINQKITDMATGVDNASSLTDIKIDINSQLQQIAKTLVKKTKLEEQQQQELKQQLKTMSAQVSTLEEQSKSFEKRIQEQQERSLKDALTKLSNRAAFDEHFANEIVRFHHRKFELALSVVDLDDFKRINDTYGHTAGDKTLQVIANTLTKVIGKDAFIGRYGGEEFVLVFSGFDKMSVINKLDVLRKKVANLPFTFKNNRVIITLSVGVTHFQTDDNIHSAFERADMALYQAKKDGKNKVVYG